MYLFFKFLTVRVSSPEIFIGFWTMVGVVTAIVAVFVAFSGAVIGILQLFSLSKTSKADFIHKFKNDFFTDETRKIFSYIDKDQVKYNVNTDEFFFRNLKTGRSSYDIDDLVLGHLEDLAVFEKSGNVSIEMVYEFFDYYIEKVYENKAIKRYIRSQDNGDIYENFRYLYQKCKSFSNAKKARVPKVIWFSWWQVKSLAKLFTC